MTEIKNRRHRRREERENWTGDDATYTARHQRVHFERGSASQFSCVDCGKTACDWSQVHGTDGLDVQAHYEPRCKSCHMRYDGAGERLRGYIHLGEAHGMHKLTERDVREIRDLVVRGLLTQLMIADVFNIHQVTVSQIKLGKRWGWLA